MSNVAISIRYLNDLWIPPIITVEVRNRATYLKVVIATAIRRHVFKWKIFKLFSAIQSSGNEKNSIEIIDINYYW